MKKLVCMIAGLLAAVAFGGGQEDNQFVTVYSNGPDRYMDGSTVLDGEFYAIVWVRKGAAVPAYSADARLLSASSDCKIVTAGRWAKSGGCGVTAVNQRTGKVVRSPYTWSVSNSDMAYYVANGSFRLCLLDTRKADNKTLADSEMTSAGYSFPKMINGYVTTAEVTGEAAALATTVGFTSPITVTTASSVPADAPKPKIVRLELRGEGASRVADIWVECTADYLRYTAGSGPTPSSDMSKEAAGAVAADGDGSKTIKVTVPATEGSGFFRVIRK